MMRMKISFVPFRVVFAIVLALSLFVPAPAASQGNQPLLDIRTRKKVKLGDSIDITLTARHVPDIAGYEVAVLYDTAVAEFGGAEQRENDLRKIGRDVSPLAAVDLPNGAAVGLFSCPTDNCVSGKGSNRKGGNGSVRLAKLFVYPNEPGTYEITIGSAKFVDSQGNPFQVDIPNPTVVVEVESAAPRYAAPASDWQLPQGPGTDPGPFDLTFDGKVDHADAMEAAIEWQITRLDGDPCAPSDPTRDVNHDGCVDVADLQLIAAHFEGGTSRLPAGFPKLASLIPVRQSGATFTVNSNGDAWDANPGNGICATPANTCTLRAAIQEANLSPGPNTINFNIPGGGLKNVKMTGRLPTLNDTSGPTTIDGYTQPGSSPNTHNLQSNANILIQFEGAGESSFDGFTITSPGNVIRGIAIYKVRRGFWLIGANADNNTITGSFIGTNVTGTYAAPAAASNAHGVHIEQGSSSNQIGDTANSERNVISGNGAHGVGIWHEDSDGNVIQNNIIGLNPSGTARLANRTVGIDFNYGSSSNIAGGTGSGERNVTSGNLLSGFEISHQVSTRDNQVIGNFVGTDLTGTRAFTYTENAYTGVTIEDGASDNLLSENVIGNNVKGGIQITGINTTNNQITNNRVGISLDDTPIRNHMFGIRADGVGNIIGPGNIVAHNRYTGIVIRESDKDFNTITRNSTFSNGGNADLGIDLFPGLVTPNDPGDGDSGANENLNFPVISSANTNEVSGTACSNCIVEVFIADSGNGLHGEGKTFIGSATASGSGSFTVQVSGVSQGQYVTATATDADGNTSEFAANRIVQ